MPVGNHGYDTGSEAQHYRVFGIPGMSGVMDHATLSGRIQDGMLSM
jgi:hypothetical protein